MELTTNKKWIIGTATAFVTVMFLSGAIGRSANKAAAVWQAEGVKIQAEEAERKRVGELPVVHHSDARTVWAHVDNKHAKKMLGMVQLTPETVLYVTNIECTMDKVDSAVRGNMGRASVAGAQSYMMKEGSNRHVRACVELNETSSGKPIVLVMDPQKGDYTMRINGIVDVPVYLKSR